MTEKQNLQIDESAVKNQNELFSSLLKSLPLGIYMVEVSTGKPLIANGEALKLLGQGIMTNDPSNIYKAYKASDLQPYPSEKMPLQLGMKGIQSHVNDMLIELPDGTRKILEVFGSPVYNDQGNIWASLVSLVDITDRKKTEEDLLLSELRFSTLLENIHPIAIQGYSQEGTTRYWNKASERIYGYTAEEAIGQNLRELVIPEEMKPGVEDAMQHMAATGEPIPAAELLPKRKDGSRVSVFSNHAIIHLPNNEKELFCFDVDITDRKKMEADLKEKMAELKMVNDVAVGRELKMIALEKEVNTLLAELGREKKYK